MRDEKNLSFEIKTYCPVDLSKQWFIHWKEHGKRKKRYGNINSGKTFKEREQLMLALIKQVRREMNPVSDLILQEMRGWLDRQRPFWKPKSIGTYLSVLNEFEKYLNGRKVNEVTVRLFFDYLAKKLKGTTFNKYREKLGRLLRVVGEGDLISGIEAVREERQPARFFQRHQIKQLKEEISCRDEHLWLFVQFIFYCFIRPAELRLLRISDILFDEQKILVRSSISKNRKSQYVVIPEAFFHNINYLKSFSNNRYIFTSRYDESKPVGVNTMSTKHRNILKELGYSSEYKLYSWKHTGAVMAVQSGVNLKELQMQLRHHSLDQVNEYLRQMGVLEMKSLASKFPSL